MRLSSATLWAIGAEVDVGPGRALDVGPSGDQASAGGGGR